MCKCGKLFAAVVLFAVASCVRTVHGQYEPGVRSPYAHHCYMVNCVRCPPHALSRRGDSVECHPTNWVSPVWINNVGHMPPTTSSIFPIEYRCIKMVATPDDPTQGRTVDVIRGCVPAVQVDSVCRSLVAAERARGLADARCFVCRGDNCNGGRKMAPAFGVMAAVVAANKLTGVV